MNFIDYKKSIVPLSSVAEMLDIKVRTLRIYEEKGLLPKYVNTTKNMEELIISGQKCIAY